MIALLPAFPMVTPIWALEKPQGKIEWVGGYIQGVGYGTAGPEGDRARNRLRAVRAAEVMAQRALAEAILGVRIDGTTVMRDAIRQYMLETRVQGVIRGAQKMREEVSWDGDIPEAMVELRICLVPGSPECRSRASLVEVLPVPDVRGSDNVIIPSVSFEDGAGVSSTFPDVTYDSSRRVTGLLLQTDGVRFVRQLFPVVVTRSKDGKLRTVYSAKSVRPEVVRTQGVARFADTHNQARNNPLIGDNPIVVTVREVTKENMLVVRPDVARTIWEVTRFGNNFLEQAKVVIAGK